LNFIAFGSKIKSDRPKSFFLFFLATLISFFELNLGFM